MRSVSFPTLSLPDLTGRVVAIPEEFRGKVVLLGFFTTTCSQWSV